MFDLISSPNDPVLDWKGLLTCEKFSTQEFADCSILGEAEMFSTLRYYS